MFLRFEGYSHGQRWPQVKVIQTGHSNPMIACLTPYASRLSQFCLVIASDDYSSCVWVLATARLIGLAVQM
jgi:hypothetical protein